MPTMPRLCYLMEESDLHDPDGIVVGQAAAFRSQGLEVTLAVRAAEIEPEVAGVPAIAVPHFGGRNLPPADCYIATSWTTAVSAHGTGLGVGVHLITTDAAGRAAEPHLRNQIELAHGMSTVKLATSPHLVDMVRARYGQDCRHAPVGIDTAVFHAHGRGEPAPAAARRVAVIGSPKSVGDDVTEIYQAVAHLDVDGVQVEIVPVAATSDVAAVADALRSCDIALLSADAAQDSPVAALRAMACGCAVILADIPTFRGLAASGGVRPPAMFVRAGDPAATAAAIAQMAVEPRLRAEIARAGAALAARYAWDVVGPELGGMFRDLVDAERDRWLVFDERMVPGESDVLTEKMHFQRYEYVARFATGRRVLDIGSGAGCGAQIYAAAGATAVHAIDRSAHALDHARRHFDHPAISWNCGDFFEYSWPQNTEELAVCLEVFEHVENPGRLMTLMVDALVDGGQAIISTPNRQLYSPDGDPVNVHHEREYELDEFTALLGAFFGQVQVIGQRLDAGVLTMGPPDPSCDLMFVAVCSRPIRRPQPDGGIRLVGVPDWDASSEWRPLVDTWCRVLEAGAPATLELAATVPERAGAVLMAALEGDGIDPGGIPDIEVTHGAAGLRGLAPLLRAASLCVPMGPDAARQRRLAECFGVACVDRADGDAIVRAVRAAGIR